MRNLSGTNQFPAGGRNKSKLRKLLRQRRRALDHTQQSLAAQRLSRNLSRHPALWRADRIACYLPFDGEIDTQPLIKKLLQRSKKVYLPVLDGQRLRFVRYRPGSAMRRNRFNIAEPKTPGEQLKPWALQLILMPLVAFDAHGHRLGMGAGFYDKTLAYTRHLPRLHKPWLIGLAHQFQQTAALRSEAWDINLDWVVTDSGTLRCQTSKPELLQE